MRYCLWKVYENYCHSNIQACVPLDPLERLQCLYILSYYMKVKPRHLLCMTYSCVTGKKDQWSAGSAVSEMTTKCTPTYGLGVQEVDAALRTRRLSLVDTLHFSPHAQGWTHCTFLLIHMETRCTLLLMHMGRHIANSSSCTWVDTLIASSHAQG